jgi:hypothetical protein
VCPSEFILPITLDFFDFFLDLLDLLDLHILYSRKSLFQPLHPLPQMLILRE